MPALKRKNISKEIGEAVVDSPNRWVYDRRMATDQLPLFKQKSFGRVAPAAQIIAPAAPTGESVVMSTLPAYLAWLRSSGYSESTSGKYFADVKKFSLYLREKTLVAMTPHDIQDWISHMLSRTGEQLERKTVNRKVSAVINYFSWIMSLEVLPQNPADTIRNRRIQAKLPDYLFENEVKLLYQQASKNPRTYLIVLLLLETGMKTQELFALKKADVDASDPYAPELWIKHSGKQVKKDRKVALPQRFVPAYEQYLAHYPVTDLLFPYTERFVQLRLFAPLKQQTKIEKELTPKTLRHTHVVRAYKRGEDKETIFERIGLSPGSWEEADEIYRKLAGRGI